MTNEPATVLIVDDDKIIRFSLSVVVKRAGYQVLTAKSGTEGLQLAQAHRPDIIICDVMMPAPDGFELRRILTTDSQIAHIPFIFLTARGSQKDMLRGLDLGADDYMTKPFDHRELIARIKAVLRRADLSRHQGKIEAEGHIQELRREILGNVSHELRTPVSLLLGSLELSLMDRFKDDLAEQETFIQTALNNAHHLQRIINDLIALSQLDQGIIDDFRLVLDLDFDLKPLVKQSIKLWSERNINIKIHANPDVIVHAPKIGFRQAIGHLIDNACKFSPDNGQIDIFVEPNGKGGCIIIIEDEGNGVDSELRETVFERFYQISQGTARSYEGLGVGLTIARAFARRLEGDVIILDSDTGCRVQMIIAPGKADWNMED